MSKDTDIKSLGVFGANSGLQKIREQYDKEKTENVVSEREIKTNKMPKKTKRKNEKGAGAPIRKFDKVYAAKKPLKLSPLLNSISKNLIEKYDTGLSRDELLRKALDEYIKQNYSVEDKQELYYQVVKELKEYRIENPTLNELDSDNETIIRSASEIEKETETELLKRWGLSSSNMF